MKYVALLRGINVGGNNKIPMQTLKECFVAMSYTDVVTYINSGNLVFSADEFSVDELTDRIGARIEQTFGFRISCLVLSAETLIASSEGVPDWWGNDATAKHNAIFVMPPVSADELVAAIGPPRPEYEKIKAVGQVVFWSAPVKSFHKTNYRKIVDSSYYKKITIRNANTYRKLVQLIN